MFSQNNTLARSVSGFMYKVYAWMSLALIASGATAYGVYSTPALFYGIVRSPIILIGMLVAQIAISMIFIWKLRSMSFPMALGLFLSYATLLGATLSVIFAVYQMASIVSVFGIAAGMFGVFALYGYFTKADLTSFGKIMTMALFGIIIASVVNMFMRSAQVDYAISFIGVIVFCGLIAFDMQKIKQTAEALFHYDEPADKIALMCALMIYLDFVNLFLFLLRLLGKRKE